jgi:signal peptidase
MIKKNIPTIVVFLITILFTIFFSYCFIRLAFYSKYPSKDKLLYEDYTFIQYKLYEKKRRFALRRVSRLWSAVSVVVSVLAIIIMIGTVMLVSNQFKYGSLVIATESMTGEINKGDVIIFESYDDHEIIEGQVIVFEKYNVMVVHRVVDIEIINGVARYYTKGDANEDWDVGYVLDSEIVGLVDYKLPVVGYPTIWMRSLFKR